MSVRRKCASESQAVGAGLLLSDSPLRPFAGLFPIEIADQFRPRDARLHINDAVDGVELENPFEARRVQQDRSGAELLTAHRMASSGDADGSPVGRRPA